MKTISDIHCFFHYLKNRAGSFHFIYAVILCFLCFSSSYSQVILQFPNGAGNGVLVAGTAGTVGAIYEWPNVGTEGAVTIKARIEIKSITGGATLTTIDGNSTAADWEPQVAGPTITAGNSWGIKFQIRFYNAATSATYVLSSLKAQGIDIDGGGTGSALREYNTFETPVTYTMESVTELTATTVTNGVKFQSSSSSFNGISIVQTQYIASCDYINISSIDITCGVAAVGGTVNATNRLHSFNFRNVVVFAIPEILLPIELTGFSAKMENATTVKINWTTVSEQNNDFFTLERMDTVDDYCDLTILNAAGNSEIESNYEYTDIHPPFNQIIYYRLKQTDYDGHTSLSQPISVDNRQVKKEISIKMDMMGHEVNEIYRGVVIVHYADGTTSKIVQ